MITLNPFSAVIESMLVLMVASKSATLNSFFSGFLPPATIENHCSRCLSLITFCSDRGSAVLFDLYTSSNDLGLPATTVFQALPPSVDMELFMISWEPSPDITPVMTWPSTISRPRSPCVSTTLYTMDPGLAQMRSAVTLIKMHPSASMYLQFTLHNTLPRTYPHSLSPGTPRLQLDTHDEVSTVTREVSVFTTRLPVSSVIPKKRRISDASEVSSASSMAFLWYSFSCP
mmetsp:Transcript_978/g.2111  ORF Transcript_978/g.2111 Transcript_978/m.2111 type:complete len:230 (+) Transcript_978:1567-2256(+)